MRLSIRALFAFCLSTILPACAIQKVHVLQISPEDFVNGVSVYIYPIQIGATLADSSMIGKESAKIEEYAGQLLKDKGYTISPAKSAEILVNIKLETQDTGLVSGEELRMMKGFRGSSFPDPNPRLRQLEADYLFLKATLIMENKPLFSAKCKLLENQDALAPSGSVRLTGAQAISCIEGLINELP